MDISTTRCTKIKDLFFAFSQEISSLLCGLELGKMLHFQRKMKTTDKLSNQKYQYEPVRFQIHRLFSTFPGKTRRPKAHPILSSLICRGKQRK